MSDLPRSSRPSSDRSKRVTSTTESSRYGSISLTKSAKEDGTRTSSRSTMPDRSSAIRRRSHSTSRTDVPPRDETDDLAARLERREERRRQREKGEGHTRSHSSGRSKSVPRVPLPPSNRSQPTSPYATSILRSGSLKTTEANHPSAHADESTDMPTSIAARKAAYLAAAENRDRPSNGYSKHHRLSIDGPLISRSLSKSTEEDSTLSPDQSARISRRKSHREHHSEKSSKKEKKSRKSSKSSIGTPEGTPGRKSRRSSEEWTDSPEKFSRSGSSGDKSRKHEKKSSPSDDGTKSIRSKERKRSSRSKEDAVERESRVPFRDASTDSDLVKERKHRSRSIDGGSRVISRSSDGLERSSRSKSRQRFSDGLDRKTARSKSRQGSVSRQDESSTRRGERLERGDDSTRGEEYRKRREERIGQREERRSRDSSGAEEVRPRRSSSIGARYNSLESRRKSSDTDAASRSPTRSRKISSSPTTRDILVSRTAPGEAGDRKYTPHGSSDAESARERLRERMAARLEAKNSSVSDAPPVPSRNVFGGMTSSGEIGDGKSQQKSGDVSPPAVRPKLVDANRRGVAIRVKQQRPIGMEAMSTRSSLPPSPPSSELDTEEESLPGDDQQYNDGDSSAGDEDEEVWTVRVCLISAVDLPLNLVPNMPLCPVLKFGLITLPTGYGDNGKPENDVEPSDGQSEQRLSIAVQLEKAGLTSIPRARIRCTSNKLLSKRDNGTVLFHEELRWDRVKQPMRTALAVELAARAALAPPNLKESPMISQTTDSVPTRPLALMKGDSGTHVRKRSTGLDSIIRSSSVQRADVNRSQSEERAAESDNTKAAATTGPQLTPSSTVSSSNAAAPAVHGAGLTGMRALWRKGRQQFEQRQMTKPETDEVLGQPSSAVAGEANGGGTVGQAGSLGRGFPASQSAKNRMAASLEDENVALLRPKKKRKLQMAEDLRIGSLVIPLTRLPLETAIKNRKAARIEMWYQLDANDVLVPNAPTWRGKSATKPPPRRSPTVQLEISFSPPEVLDESEDEMDDMTERDLAVLGGDDAEDERKRTASSSERSGQSSGPPKSFSRRMSIGKRIQEKPVVAPKEPSPPARPDKEVSEDPVLEPGLVDFICVVGVNSIGDQKDDDGSKGWVNTSPECTLLEQFPPTDEFHIKNGRNVALANKVEWFCYPEGWRLWRGTDPPSTEDINIERLSISAASMPIVSKSLAAFDSCLGCSTSFSWFVISTNSDEYGSRNVKTYGACIKFYAPAPKGIDQTQDDYAQTMMGVPIKAQAATKGISTAKRLWVPMGICLTSNLPIVGVMEAMLLRICENLASKTGGSLNSVDSQGVQSVIQKEIANLILNFQKPIPGVLHCSIPFLSGERLHITLPPPTGLPPLPHGSAVTAVCRLLGADGLNMILAAVLTECKILIHSHEVSNLAMVAEVITTLIYPFYWALPYVPVLPGAMLEFIEAPLSYLLGIPTASLKLVDPNALEDVVVVDLDSNFTSPDYFEGRRAGKSTKAPTPLPASVATKISKAVFRLLREEGEVEDEYHPGSRSLPRLESESLAEREFRIAVALQVCGLVRGYDDCLFKVSASQPVFNRDKFLRTAPALFENQRSTLPLTGPGSVRGASSRTLSPRSKRFLSILVNCQHFHQFLDMLEDDECAFFNEVMYTFDMNEEQEDDRMLGGYGTSSTDEAAAHLSKALQKVEDKVPTYRVERKGKKKKRSTGGWDDDDDDIGLNNQTSSPERGRDKNTSAHSFPFNILQPLCVDTKPVSTQPRQSNGADGAPGGSSESAEGVHKMSVELLLELEKGSWSYEKQFEIPVGIDEEGEQGETPFLVEIRDKVRLREAIGERRYRAWKLAQEQKFVSDDPGARLSSEEMISAEANPALDLTSLLSSMADETSDAPSVPQSALSIPGQNSSRPSTLSPEQQRVADAKDREVLRRCLERAYGSSSTRPSEASSPLHSISDSFFENGRDLIAEAETALRNSSAQRFLVSVLSQRSRLESQKRRRSVIEDPKGARRQTAQTSVSRLETSSFECLVRLCCAMLDSCMESKEYEPAYGLLTHTAGFCTIQTKEGRGVETQRDDAAQDPGNKVIYMTARIGLHPIFADLRLWEEVLRLHLKDRENDKTPGAGASLIGKANNSDLVEYEAAVATLYEMLGFGIPAEELARFATQVSEERKWFETERGHSLVMLARRLGVRKEQGDEGAGTAGDLDLMGNTMNFQGVTGVDGEPSSSSVKGVGTVEDSRKVEWTEIGWCHPAAPSTVRPQYVQSGASVEEKLSGSRHLKRSAVTSVASFGSSIVASGGLDGSVFVAHTIQFERDEDGKRSENCVQGVHLDWGSSGSRTAAVASSVTSMDGEYGVGAVSCLVAAKGAGYRSSALSASGNKDVQGKFDQEEFLSAMEGCRVVAGTTAGDLRVWSVKDVYAATVLAKKGSGIDGSNDHREIHSGSGATSSFIGKAARRGSITDIAAGSASSRLNFSLRGRALSGHRGGVSCLDVPSHIYRPDALITGGADGFIKLWSLRQPIAGRREVLSGPKATMFSTGIGASPAVDPMGQARTTRSGDALSILSGHAGRVLCVKTAWHGDRLLSGGADRTVRIWDLAGSGGKCLHTLTGHLGWVTHTHYWGQHTIVTASTDRSIALWDPRVRRSPLFILRHHYSPVSDLLVGSRTDPLMVSAAGDGTIATWDFRALSGSNKSTENPAEQSTSPVKTEGEKIMRAVRTPIATMKHATEGRGVRQSGSVMLARGVAHKNTVLSVGVDAIVREWDIGSGRPVSQEATGHCDGISGLATFSDSQNTLGAAEPGGEGNSSFGGIITSSWDGTIRMRKFVRK